MTVPGTVFTASTVITMDPAHTGATGILVTGDRITAVGDAAELSARPGVRVDDTFVGATVLPGLIDQHLHPVLGATTLVTDVIATEDWELPGRMCPAALTQDEYRQRLRDAAASDTTGEWLFSWGITSSGTAIWTAGSSTASAPPARSRCGSAAVMNGS